MSVTFSESLPEGNLLVKLSLFLFFCLFFKIFIQSITKLLQLLFGNIF